MWFTGSPLPVAAPSAGEDASGNPAPGGEVPVSALASILLAGLEGTNAAVCLSDADDNIRFLNAAFRASFLPDMPAHSVNFTDAVCETIAAGKGIKLESMPLERFRQAVRERRRGGKVFAFCVDCQDGTWWRMEDHRLANGWILAIGTDITGTKSEEIRLREAHAAALKASQTDYLTGLPNRRWGMEGAEAALEAARVGRTPLTLALLDIDHFKAINDRHGHDTGDAVLIHFAQELAHRLGGRDQTSRIGGEEFMVLMPDTPLLRAKLRLERLLRVIAPLPGSGERRPLAFSFSAGAVAPFPGETLKSLLSRADAALYAAKAKGRSRIECPPESESDAA